METNSEQQKVILETLAKPSSQNNQLLSDEQSFWLGAISSVVGSAVSSVVDTASSGVNTITETVSSGIGVVTETASGNINGIIAQISSLVSGSDIAESQKETAIEIIKAGKENGIDELEIDVSQTVGLKILSGLEGLSTDATIGTAGKMTIKVKYK